MADATEVLKVEDKPSIEDFIWKISQGYGHAINGMVVRRGSLQVLTTRDKLNEMFSFSKHFWSKQRKY